MKVILEGEDKEEDQKPLELVTESLKGYIKDLKEFQEKKGNIVKENSK